MGCHVLRFWLLLQASFDSPEPNLSMMSNFGIYLIQYTECIQRHCFYQTGQGLWSNLHISHRSLLSIAISQGLKLHLAERVLNQSDLLYDVGAGKWMDGFLLCGWMALTGASHHGGMLNREGLNRAFTVGKEFQQTG